MYCSPYLRARPGSRHGYDIVDHAMLNPEIGTREEFDAMVDTLARHGMSHLCDVVPNHMAIMGQDNAWWMDVLENGPASAYAGFFDIDWTPQDAALSGKVLVPVLGESYGAVLERGELRLGFEGDSGTFAVRYFEHRFPLDPREYPPVLEAALAGVSDRLPADAAAELKGLIAALRALPERTDGALERAQARQRDAARHKAGLRALAGAHPPLSEAIASVLAHFNGLPGTPDSFEPLHALLEAQAFRLAYWRVASDEINYRRFFDVNDLASLRMENEAAFEATHGFLLDLAADGRIGGLRIDHPDGLRDPARYFSKLQQAYQARVAQRRGAQGESPPAIYVVLEKISAPHERMPADWPVHGDTGYPFANAINAVLVDPTTRARIDRAWRVFVGSEAQEFEQAVYEGKRAIMRGPLAAGLIGLASHALRIARADRRTRDFTLNTLREALAETVAWFPVYRTYVGPEGASAQDRRYIDWAVTRARRASRVADPSIFDFIRSLLLASPPAEPTAATTERFLAFAMRFQQFTAPVAAKGVEDTSFYSHTRFLSLSDVGGDPAQFGMTRRAFHRVSADRAQSWPHTMLATSTHDNKRSEDVRTRIDVISEIPAAWRLTVRRWSRMNRSRKQVLDGLPAPSRSDEYLLYQTLAGTFPAGERVPEGEALSAYRERIENYLVKAAREAKTRTSWLRVDPAYERALTGFVGALLAERADNPFLDDLRAQVDIIAWFGMLNSLSLMLVKLASPGVPDIYQGNEILDFSLVDPDNRRPVDYEQRRTLLGSLQQLEDRTDGTLAQRVQALFDNPYDGRAKLWIACRMLGYRRQQRAIFDAGDYLPMTAVGARGRHVLAFARRHAGHGVVAVAGRLFASLGLRAHALPLGEAAWGDTVLDLRSVPAGTTVTDVLTGATLAPEGGTLPLAKVFACFPGALLAW